MNKDKPKKINVLYIAQPHYIGGAERTLADIIKNLNPAIFNHTVMFPCEGEAVKLFRPHRIKIMLMGKSGGAKKWLLSFIRKQRISIVYTNTTQIFEAAMTAKSAGIPHIWHMHSRLDSVYPRAGPSQIRRILELMYLLSTKIIVCSDFVKNQFKEYGLTDKVVKINYGVDLKNFSSLIRNAGDDFSVGMVSRFDPQKRPQDFIEAAMQVKRRASKVRFVLIGTGLNREYMAGVKKMNSQNGSPVKFAGFCNDMPRVMRSLDVSVLPSIGDASPLAILEAMACGKPVIATDSGGIPEIVIDGKTGILVPPKRPSILADAIMRLVNNPGKAKSMGELGRARVEKYYDIIKTTQKLQDILLSSIQR